MLQDRQDMRTMFRVCATERLFVPDIFPDMDRAIYIDTDLIFMRLVFFIKLFQIVSSSLSFGTVILTLESKERKT